jgi:hypothetical protein
MTNLESGVRFRFRKVTPSLPGVALMGIGCGDWRSSGAARGNLTDPIAPRPNAIIPTASVLDESICPSYWCRAMREAPKCTYGAQKDAGLPESRNAR